MRPYSDVRVDLAAALIDGEGTTKQLAQRTGLPVSRTRRALDNMVRAGDAMKMTPVRVPGVKRPVPVYGRAVRADDMACDAEPFVSLIQAWASMPARQPVEAVM
jgi:hypothetical protein